MYILKYKFYGVDMAEVFDNRRDLMIKKIELSKLGGVTNIVVTYKY